MPPEGEKQIKDDQILDLIIYVKISSLLLDSAPNRISYWWSQVLRKGGTKEVVFLPLYWWEFTVLSIWDISNCREGWKLVVSENILVYTCMHAKSLHLCPTHCNPMDCGPPGSSVPGIFQTRILEWVAMPSCRVSSWPRNRNCTSDLSCIGRWVLYYFRHLGSPESKMKNKGRGLLPGVV